MSKVLFASSVTLYKFDAASNRYEDNKRQVGAAITGDIPSRKYQLVCYADQESYVCTATITSSNAHGVKFQSRMNDNYATFRDDKGDQWSMYFAEEQQLQQFSLRMALASFGAAGFPSHAITQVDMCEGSSDAVDVGNSVGVKFNGYYVTQEDGAPTLSHQFDTNLHSAHTYKFKIPPSNTQLDRDMKGFEGAVCGMKEGGRRVLVIPGACRRGGNNVAQDSTLIFLIDVKKVKRENLADQDDRSKVIDRIARQGGQPQQGFPTTSPQYREDDAPTVVPQGFQDFQRQQMHLSQQPVAMLTGSQPGAVVHYSQPQPVPMAQLVAQPTVVPSASSPATPSPAEPTKPPGLTPEQLRTVNETSTNVTTLISNLHEVSQKIDLLTADFKMAQKQQKPTTLTAAQLQHSVTEMIDENKRLKDEVRTKEDMIKTLENRALDLEKKVDKFASSAHQLMEEKKAHATSATDTKLEMDRRVLKLQEELQRAHSERDDSQRHLATVKRLLDLSEEEMRKVKGEAELTKVQTDNLKMKLSHAEDSLRTEKEARKLSDERVIALSEELSEARDEIKRKEASIQEKLRKMDADRLHFNNLLEEERKHADDEASRLRDEMLQDLQAREKRFASEKERIAADQFSRGEAEGMDKGMQEARLRYEEEISQIKAAAVLTQEQLQSKISVLQVEKETAGAEIESLRQQVDDLVKQVETLTDKTMVQETELSIMAEKLRIAESSTQSQTESLQEKIEGLTKTSSELMERLRKQDDELEAALERATKNEDKLQDIEVRCTATVQNLSRPVVPRGCLTLMLQDIFAGKVPDTSFEDDDAYYPMMAGPPSSARNVETVMAGSMPERPREAHVDAARMSDDDKDEEEQDDEELPHAKESDDEHLPDPVDNTSPRKDEDVSKAAEETVGSEDVQVDKEVEVAEKEEEKEVEVAEKEEEKEVEVAEKEVEEDEGKEEGGEEPKECAEKEGEEEKEEGGEEEKDGEREEAEVKKEEVEEVAQDKEGMVEDKAVEREDEDDEDKKESVADKEDDKEHEREEQEGGGAVDKEEEDAKAVEAEVDSKAAAPTANENVEEAAPKEDEGGAAKKPQEQDDEDEKSGKEGEEEYVVVPDKPKEDEPLPELPKPKPSTFDDTDTDSTDDDLPAPPPKPAAKTAPPPPKPAHRQSVFESSDDDSSTPAAKPLPKPPAKRAALFGDSDSDSD